MVGAEQAARFPLIGHWLARFLFGGATLSGATLSRFYGAHTLLLPVLLAGMLGLHLYLVIRNGISEPQVPGQPVDPAAYRATYEALLRRSGVPFWPDAAWRDAVFGLGVVVAVLVLAITIGPPGLSGPPDPTIVHVYPAPDFYLLWYFAILALHPAAD